MALSGRPDGPPLVAPGAPASYAARRLAAFAAAAAARRGAFDLAAHGLDTGVLGERAAIAGLTRQGPRSCGGAFRTMPTTDGWLGLSLPRPDDIEMVPALIEAVVDADPWQAVADWAADHPTGDAVARAHLLGLAAAAWPPAPSRRPGVVLTEGATRQPRERPLVVDLTSLWAGPLCAHLLGLAGCRVVKVESTGRLDGARFGPAGFYDLLHAAHESVTLDFADPSDVHRLRELIGRADLVLEASRPRALQSLGILAEDHVAAGTTWVSITARGRASDTIGFGDDVALAAGLAVPDGTGLLPVGDALADPLAGLAAAAAAAEALLPRTARLVDVSMLHVAEEAAARPAHEATVIRRDGEWWVETASGLHPVEPPRARRPSGTAAQPGADNPRWWR
ncbi:hypothetical protein GHK92_17300 [Nocardioides sp. dk4132]|nr:hypothetical protein [Nocardioides sp. dk4132]QGA09493.1 hypothetical protein GFH29_01160 [Nocardioides sp. dk884]